MEYYIYTVRHARMHNASRMQKKDNMPTSWRVVYRSWMLLCIACFVCIIPGCRVAVGEDCVDVIGIAGQIFNSCIDSVPPAPITHQETLVSDTAITITWTPSVSDDVAEIRMTWSSEHDPTEHPRIMESTSVATTITALQPHTKYTFNINAVDASGNVSPTAEITATTAASILLADAPSFSNVETPGSTVGQVSATVNPPNTAITIASYEIIANRDDDGALFAIDTQTGEITVADSILDPYASYTFTVQATSTQGISTTTIVTVAPTDTTAPAPITALHANTVAGTSGVALTWIDSPSTDVRHVRITWQYQDGSGGIGGPILVLPGTQSATISALDSEQAYTFTLVAEDGTHTSAAESVSVTTGDTTAPDSVTMLRGTADSNGTSIDLSWNGPYSTDVASVTVAWALSGAPDIIGSTPASTSSGSVVHTITDLIPYTLYHISITVTDTAGNARTRSISIRTAANRIDSDGDSLIDINTLSALHNMRYNLVGTSYKESTGDGGILCGRSADTICIGYELTQDLDFTDAASYDNGVVNAAWRPQNSSGVVLAQANASSATNAGWDPIGSCNADTGDGGNAICGDADDTPFATRFEGNGYTISNLYARNTSANNGSAIGLFGITAAVATIRSIGVQDIVLYSGRESDRVGGIVGDHGGTIVGSYASGGSATGDNKRSNDIGGLVGRSNGTIIASYAAVDITSGNAISNAGGLVGNNMGGIIIASYATGDVAGSHAGGLVGNSTTSVIATYASGTVTGRTSGTSYIGGLVGAKGNIHASYATGNVDGVVSGILGGALSGAGPTTTNNSYGFGSVTTASIGSAGNTKPTVNGTAITSARQLTLSNVNSIWNHATHDTLHAWNFGNSTQIPALRYADYDGPGNNGYHCGNNNKLTGIPTIVASPSGPLPVNCGTTLLPGQRP